MSGPETKANSVTINVLHRDQGKHESEISGFKQNIKDLNTAAFIAAIEQQGDC